MNDVFESSANMKFGIGQPIRRFEDLRLLTGKGRYQDDQTFDRQTWCVFVRSPHAHALIRSVDTQAAAAAPGVVAVFTGTDFANEGIATPKAAMPRKKRDGSPMFAPQRPAMVIDRARYVGDTVAMVIAETLGAGEGRRRTGAGGLRPSPGGDERRGSGGSPTRRGCGTKTRTISPTPRNAATVRRPRRRLRAPRML